MNEQAISSPSQVIIYNPNEIINIFSESLSRRGPGIVKVRGIYHRGKGGNYGGYFYDSLKDEFSPYEMSIKIPEGLRSGQGLHQRDSRIGTMSLLGSYFKEYIVNGALGDYVSVKNGQWIVLRSEIDWCDED